MNSNEIREMIVKDSEIDITNLDSEALKISYLHGKWCGFFIDESRLYRKLINEQKKLRLHKLEYYTGKCEDAVYEANPLDKRILKTDAGLYIDTDTEVCSLDEKVELQRLKVSMIEGFMKMLSNRGFHIKSAIDFIKFKNGIS